MKKIIPWDTISEEELLNTRICDLPLEIKGTWLEECIEHLYKELGGRGLVFQPECYLADEWLTPENETCIGIPFYLAHPVLTRLEKKIMFEAEGDTKPWCMKLLRHETGHAICYAYQFHKRASWRRVFGPSSLEYGETYKYRPYSKNYVRYLDGYYAQYHPDEDFVETFAVWLTPDLNWRQQYQGWGALEKLEYVDRLMAEIKGKEPPVKNKNKYWHLRSLRLTLKSFYKKKRHFWAEDFPDFHDAFLAKTFVPRGKEPSEGLCAADLIHRYRRGILNSVSRCSGARKYVISDLLKDIQKRSRELNLTAPSDEASVVLNLSVYITSLIMNYIYTGRFRGARPKGK